VATRAAVPVVEDEAKRTKAVKSAIEEEAVVETSVIIETEIVVAVVSGGGARSAHHETGDG
jgi:hypothetical protein